MIAAVVITHNRLERLQLCVERVLKRASHQTTEIVVWDNASTDGTREYLGSLDDARIDVVLHEANIGQNGYARGFRRTNAPYLVELDDDVVDAPADWDQALLDAFVALDDIGFLAADIVDDPTDWPSFVRHHVRGEQYVPYTHAGIRLLDGPAGGACAMTSRDLVDRVGGFPEYPGKAFFSEEAEFIRRLGEIGYRPAILADLQVHHQGGPKYAFSSVEKTQFWIRFNRRLDRRKKVKRLLLRIPSVARLNRRYRWFEPPAPLVHEAYPEFEARADIMTDLASQQTIGPPPE